MATRREQPGWPPGERGTAEQEPGFLLGSGGDPETLGVGGRGRQKPAVPSQG